MHLNNSVKYSLTLLFNLPLSQLDKLESSPATAAMMFGFDLNMSPEDEQEEQPEPVNNETAGTN